MALHRKSYLYRTFSQITDLYWQHRPSITRKIICQDGMRILLADRWQCALTHPLHQCPCTIGSGHVLKLGAMTGYYKNLPSGNWPAWSHNSIRTRHLDCATHYHSLALAPPTPRPMLCQWLSQDCTTRHDMLLAQQHLYTLQAFRVKRLHLRKPPQYP